MDFSVRVKELCKEKGITMKDLAEKRLGITPTGLSKSLGQNYPQLQTLERIANALGVELADLFVKPYSSEGLKCPKCGAKLKLVESEEA